MVLMQGGLHVLIIAPSSMAAVVVDVLLRLACGVLAVATTSVAKALGVLFFLRGAM